MHKIVLNSYFLCTGFSRVCVCSMCVCVIFDFLLLCRFVASLFERTKSPFGCGCEGEGLCRSVRECLVSKYLENFAFRENRFSILICVDSWKNSDGKRCSKLKTGKPIWNDRRWLSDTEREIETFGKARKSECRLFVFYLFIVSRKKKTIWNSVYNFGKI